MKELEGLQKALFKDNDSVSKAIQNEESRMIDQNLNHYLRTKRALQELSGTSTTASSADTKTATADQNKDK